MLPLGIEPKTFRLLSECSTTEPQELFFFPRKKKLMTFSNVIKMIYTVRHFDLPKNDLKKPNYSAVSLTVA